MWAWVVWVAGGGGLRLWPRAVCGFRLAGRLARGPRRDPPPRHPSPHPSPQLTAQPPPPPSLPPSPRLEALPKHKDIFVNPDCGLKTRGWVEVEQQLRNLVSAAKWAREKYSVKA